MKAIHGVPLAICVAIGMAVAVLYPEQQRAKQAQQRLDYAMNQAHDPDRYKFPMCHSRDNEGWGLYRSNTDYGWRVVKPGKDPERFMGHWSQFKELSNLYCEEQ